MRREIRRLTFSFFFDQEVKTESPNIHIEKTTLEHEVLRASKALKEKVEINSAYKFCDLRLFLDWYIRIILLIMITGDIAMWI